ncbi:A/G-specific adenine glycosylase, partial [Vibrio parahaemolyticus EKP-028]
KPAS